MESTASCSRGARLPLLHCRQLRRSSPFVGSVVSDLPQDHIVTMPRLSEHPRRREPCDFAICGSPRRITQSWWRAHQTRIAAKVPQLECLVVLISPAPFFIGVFSFGRVLLQVVNPILRWGTTLWDAQSLRTCEAFSFAFGLSFTFAFAFAFPLGLFDGSSCFFKLRPRLAIARYILRCALPLASRGGILGPLTLFTFSFALALRNRVERFEQLPSKTCARFWTELVSLPL